MAFCYEIGSPHNRLKNDLPSSSQIPTLCVVDSQEFEEMTFLEPDVHKELDDLEAAESNYVEVFPEFLIGSFAIPDKDNPREVEPDLFSFFLDSSHLIFVDDGSMAGKIIESLHQRNALKDATLGHCLLQFFRHLLDGDLIFLGDLEDEMEDLEEAMLERNEHVQAVTITAYRRLTMRLDAYYQQIDRMADLIADNENGIMDESDARAFERVCTEAQRLMHRTGSIKEYSLQLQELYQTRIDQRQNTIMQVFTIVTVLFAPLTLVTSWYGMNLSVLPGLNWPYMWLALIGAGIVLVVVLLWWFKRRRWL